MRCVGCGKDHPSAVCPFCGRVGEGVAALNCIEKDGPCRGCRSCFECGTEFDGTNCAKCGFPRGWSMCDCRHCGARQAAFLPHWGDHCNMYTLDCARCGKQTVELCIC